MNINPKIINPIKYPEIITQVINPAQILKSRRKVNLFCFFFFMIYVLIKKNIYETKNDKIEIPINKGKPTFMSFIHYS